ncbi:ABC transporter permease [Nocardioides sp. BYT-33-1]|uniref:ABC transporter permease n=1 Tax=Nocardioides sp. BYT-33-1 TaxID=3416952 RepID=UPI003F536CD4
MSQALASKRPAASTTPTAAGGDPSPGARTRRRRPDLRAPVKAVVGLLAVLGLWEAAVRITRPAEYLLVGPVAAFRRLGEEPGYFLGQAWVTVQEALAGFALGTLLGILCGAALYYVPVLRHFLYPSLIAFDTIPKVALAPLFIVWFGFGFESKALVAMAIAFFPLVINTFDGLASVPQELKELARINRASTWMRMTKIEFIYALPSVFTGAKISISLAVGGAVVGEFIAGSEGLGQVILLANSQVDLPTMFAAFMVLAAISLALFSVISLLAQRLLPWRNRVK